ncbi:type VII secretion protein EssC [uncultured Lactobacillus sp.]|uniref:type VII secretion protein EssC n=1 Tax=uncultured Lactobacillus sp. TaxID=153152 RepID=UPI002634AD1A|nr:type VII secretion protein EssC [uncultured Lactobacillus sp.]
MNLREINQLFADPQAKFDDEIKENPEVKYDVFKYGESFEHFTSIQRPDDKDLVVVEHDKLKIYLTNEPYHDLVLANSQADIVINETTALVKFIKKSDGYEIKGYANKAQLYWNGQKQDRIKTDFKIGDTLVIDGALIQRRPKQWKIIPINTNCQLNIDELLPQKMLNEYPVKFPEFRRSPRLYLRLPKDKIRLQPMPKPKQEKHSAVWGMLLPPLGMVIASIFMTFMSHGNPAMILGMGSMSIMTAGYSVASYFVNKKKDKQDNAHQEEVYKNYLVRFAGRLDELNARQKSVLEYNFPNMEKLSQMLVDYNPRIYERLPKNEDFLEVSLGHGTLSSSYSIEYDDNDAKELNDVEKFVRKDIINRYSLVRQAPITTSLKESTVGLVGNLSARNEALQTSLFQIASFHSYRDVQFILISSQDDYEKIWREWRWLPHFQIQSLNLRGMVYNAQTRDMILNSFYQLLVKRRQELKDNSNQDIVFGPHFVLVITDESLITGSNLNEFLAEDMSQYGVTVIWSKDTQSMLPETVDTLVSYNNTQAARLINDKNVYRNQEFVPNHRPQENTIENAIKHLANLNLVEVEKNSIPESISFLEMYGVKNINELNILDRWNSADTSKTLAVPLGLRGKNDVVYLNLHEKAHGPHGLIAGTTGSGKSELVQSYILSLAVNFSPEDVGFLPIDYKGGGMANLFSKLPHMLGSITNLGGAGTQRALKSIHAELTKRQRWFNQYHVNNINAYTKLYKQGKKINDPDEKKKYPQKPLPHLFLISDEFAELKANEPEFMDELVSTARIGRSLGVHLILATQKPSGVVNDQIWSNSKFKIALKVSEPSDSKEILHTPDAATITQPGRAYLQVGNNEIYELFQSAWSGASYDPNGDKNKNTADERIWIINHLGQAELLTGDLSANDQDFNQNNETTELEAIISEIVEESKQINLVLPDKPWLPELASEVVIPEIDWRKQWKAKRQLKVPFGLIDIPEQQKQAELEFDLVKFNPAVIIGSSGYGKSTALQEIVMSLASYNSPQQVQFNLLDFGNNGLLPLAKLPHVADIVSPDEQEKFAKMLKLMEENLDSRKALFQEYGVANFEQYEKLTGNTLPIIVNVLDAYDSVSEMDSRDAIDSIINRILREGSALGIFMIMTSNRSGVYRMSMQSNINKKLILYLVDEDDLRTVLGRNRLVQSPIPGRGQAEFDDNVESFQVYQPAPGNSSLELIENLNKVAKEMDSAWSGERPAKIAMLPLSFGIDYYEKRKDIEAVLSQGYLPLGFDIEDTTAVNFVPNKHHFFMLQYNTDEQRNMLETNVIFQFIKTSRKTYLFDVEDGYYEDRYKMFDKVFTGESEDMLKATKLLAKYLELASNKQLGEEAFVFIPSIKAFMEKSGITINNLTLALKQAWKAGLYIIFMDSATYLENSFDLNLQEIKKIITAGLVTARVYDTNYISVTGSSFEKQLAQNEAYFFDSKGTHAIKIRLAGDK